MRFSVGAFELTWLHLAGIVAALGLIAVLIVVAVMLPREPADTLDTAAPPARYEWVTTDRLVLPGTYSQPDALEWIPHRPRRETWTDEQVDEYWLDPEEIGLEVLDARVEEQIRELLREVP